MSIPLIEPHWNIDVLIDVEGLRQALGEDINEVVIAVGAVVELDAKSGLPLLSLQHLLRVVGMKDESKKVQFAHSAEPGTRLQVDFGRIAQTGAALVKADFGIEIRTDLAVFPEKLKPIGVVVGRDP